MLSPELVITAKRAAAASLLRAAAPVRVVPLGERTAWSRRSKNLRRVAYPLRELRRSSAASTSIRDSSTKVDFGELMTLRKCSSRSYVGGNAVDWIREYEINKSRTSCTFSCLWASA